MKDYVFVPKFYISTPSANHNVEECMYLTHVGEPSYFARLIPASNSYDIEILTYFHGETPAPEIMEASIEQAYAFIDQYVSDIRARVQLIDELFGED